MSIPNLTCYRYLNTWTVEVKTFYDLASLIPVHIYIYKCQSRVNAIFVRRHKTGIYFDLFYLLFCPINSWLVISLLMAFHWWKIKINNEKPITYKTKSKPGGIFNQPMHGSQCVKFFVWDIWIFLQTSWNHC